MNWTVRIVLIILLGAVLFLWHKERKNSERIAKKIYQSHAEASYWKDRYGRSHAEIEVLTLRNKEMRDAMPGLIESIKKDFTNVKPKTITSVVTIETIVRDTIPFPVDNPLGFRYDDGWNKFSITPDSLLRIAIRDSLALVTSTKSSGFLNRRKKYTVEAVSYNPKTTISGIRKIEIEPKQPKIGAGLMVGYGATRDGIGPFIGAGVYYRIF